MPLLIEVHMWGGLRVPRNICPSLAPRPRHWYQTALWVGLFDLLSGSQAQNRMHPNALCLVGIRLSPGCVDVHTHKCCVKTMLASLCVWC